MNLFTSFLRTVALPLLLNIVIVSCASAQLNFTYTQLDTARTCDTNVFHVNVHNTGSTTATNLVVHLDIDPDAIITDSDYPAVLVGGTNDQYTMSIPDIPQGGDIDITYKLYFPCNLVRENNVGGIIKPYELTDDLWIDNNGTPGNYISHTYPVTYPLIETEFANIATISAHIGQQFSRRVGFINVGTQDFKGAIYFRDSIECSALRIDTLKLWLGSVLLAQTDTVDTLMVWDLCVPPVGPDSVLWIEEIITVTGCIKNCESDITFHWGCDTPDLCKTINLAPQVDRDATRPIISVSKTEPVGIHESDPMCMRSPGGIANINPVTDLRWFEYVFRNTGSSPAFDFKPQLQHNGNYSEDFIFLPYVEARDGQGNVIPPHPGIVYYSQGPNSSFCVDSAYVHGIPPINLIFWVIDSLGVGDSITIRYGVYRCCQGDDRFFNTTKYFDDWFFRGNDGPDKMYEDECGKNFQLTSGISYQELFLDQQILTTTSHLTGPGDGGCKVEGTEGFMVENMAFNPIPTPVSRHYKLFGLNKNAPPNGLMRVDFITSQGLNIMFDTCIKYELNGRYWCPDSVVEVLPYGSNGGVKSAYFSFDTFANYADFRDYMDKARLHFCITPCCPFTAPVEYTANTYFNLNPDSCGECWIAMASVGSGLQVHCPGCITPGIIVNKMEFRRTSFGFEDVDDNGMVDLPVTQIISASQLPDPITEFTSMPGDTVLCEIGAYGQDGDPTDGGVSYVQWLNHWGPGGDSMDYLFIDVTISNAASTGFNWQVISDSLKIVDTGRSPIFNSGWFSISNFLIFEDGQYFYRICIDSLRALGKVPLDKNFNPNDLYDVKIEYAICGNNSGLDWRTECEGQVYMFWSDLPHVETAKLHYLQAGAADTWPPVNVDTLTPDLLYYCEAYGRKHFVYPYKVSRTLRWYYDHIVKPAITCRRQLQCYTHVSLGSHNCNRSNLFPGEFRPIKAQFKELQFTIPNRHVFDGLHLRTTVPAYAPNCNMFNIHYNDPTHTYTVNGNIGTVTIPQSIYANAYATNPGVDTCMYGDEKWNQYLTAYFMVDTFCFDTSYSIITNAGLEHTIDLPFCDTPSVTLLPTDQITPNNERYTIPNPNFSVTYLNNNPYNALSDGCIEIEIEKLTYNHYAENFYIIVDAPSAHLNITDVFQVQSGGGLITKPKVDGVYQIGTFAATKLKFRICFDIISCDTPLLVEIPIRFGHDCNGYPEDSTDFGCHEDTAFQIINKIAPNISNGLVFQEDTVPPCDTIDMGGCTWNISHAHINDLQVVIELPPGTAMADVEMTFGPAYPNPVLVQPKSVTGNTYIYDMPNSQWQFNGQITEDTLCVFFGYFDTLSCPEDSAALPTLQISGVAYCGDTLTALLDPFSPVVISGGPDLEMVHLSNDPLYVYADTAYFGVNLSNISLPGTDAEYVYIIPELPQGSGMRIIQVNQVVSQTPTPLPKVDGVYQLGTLTGGSGHNLQICMVIDSCDSAIVKIPVRYGFGCNDYPADSTEPGCLEDTLCQTIIKLLPALDGHVSLVDSIYGPCDTIFMQGCAWNTTMANLGSLSVTLTLPPNTQLWNNQVGMSFSPDFPSPVSVSPISISGQLYTFNVPNSLWEFSGPAAEDTLCVGFGYYYSTGSCNANPADTPVLEIIGVAYCGDTIRDTLPIANPNTLTIPVLNVVHLSGNPIKAFSDTTCFDISIQNLAPSGATAHNAYIMLNPPMTSTLHPQSVSLVNGGITTLITPVNGVYQLGNIPGGSNALVRICFGVYPCESNPLSIIPIRYGYDCSGYPADTTGSGCFEDTTYQNVEQVLPGLTTARANQDLTIAYCDTIDFEWCVTSYNEAQISNFFFEIVLPPNTTLVDAHACFLPMYSTPIQVTPYGVIGNVYYFNAPNPNWMFNSNNGDTLCIKWRYKYNLGCEHPGSYTPSVHAHGITYCGDTVSKPYNSFTALNVNGNKCEPVVEVASNIRNTCEGSTNGSIEIEFSGVEPMTFLWSPSAPNNDSIYGLDSGIYQLIVLDGNGCPWDFSFYVGYDTIIKDSIVVGVYDSCYCCVELIAPGNGLCYVWNTGDSTPSIQACMKDSFIVFVKNQNGCSYSTGVRINNLHRPVIGLPLSNTKLSDWINSGVLPPGSALNDTFCVNGIVDMDVTYSFTSCALYFSPGAGMDVTSGNVQFSGPNSLLDANPYCDTMWRGLKVTSTGSLNLITTLLRNAHYGTEVQDQSSGIIYNSDYVNNFISIFMPPPQYDNSLSGSVNLQMYDNSFEAEAPGLLPLYNGQTNILNGLLIDNVRPAQGRRSFAGIYAINQLNLTIDGDQLTSLPPGIHSFKGSSNGIFIENRVGSPMFWTTLNCAFEEHTNSTYQGMTNYPITSRYIGNGIFELTQNSTNMSDLEVYESSFDACTKGVHVRNTNLSVHDVSITNSLRGIQQNFSNQATTFIYDNFIQATRDGIFLNVNDPFNQLRIMNNEVIITGDTKLGHGIYSRHANSSLPATNGADIMNNHVSMHKGKNGIALSNTNGYNVFNNEVFILDDPAISAVNTNYGINSGGGRNNTISFNQVSYASGGIGQLNTTDPVAIRTNGTSNYHILCNATDKTYTGIQIRGSVSNLLIQGNSMNDHNTGLHYHSSVSGSNLLQPYHSNQWPGSYGTPSAGVIAGGAYHSGSNFVSHIYTINVPFAGSPLAPPSVFPAVGWFDLTGTLNNGNYCNTGSNKNNFGDEPLIGKIDIQSYELTASGNLPVSIYREALNIQAQHWLYEQIKSDHTLLESEIIDSFYRTAEQTPLAALYKGRILQHEAIEMTRAESKAIQQLKERAEAEVKLIKALDESYYQNQGQEPEYNSKRQDHLNKLAEIADEIYSLNNEKSVKENAGTDAALDILTATKSSNTIEYNELYTQMIWLQTTVNGEIYDKAYLPGLIKIADQCPIEGGNGVYSARALVSLYIDKIWHDEERCGKAEPADETPVQITPATGNLKGLIVPNPNTGEFQLVFDRSVKGIAEIYDNLGRLIRKTEIIDRNTTLDLDEENGIYLIMLRDEKGKIVWKQKMLLVK